VLLLDNLVNLGQIVLNFSSVAIFSELSSGGHLFDIMFKFPNGWPRYFRILHITLGINGGLRCGWILNILVHGRCPKGLLAVSDKLVTEILG